MNNKKILLIDDELEFLQVLAERLAARGLQVLTAQSGEQALELVQERSFDAVVLDLAMPGLDGVETLRRMRELRPGIQVILLTGQATVQKSVEVMKLGAVDLLEKPVDFRQLLSKIEEASSRRAAVIEQKIDEDIERILRKRGW